jgi:hypothetical protein
MIQNVPAQVGLFIVQYRLELVLLFSVEFSIVALVADRIVSLPIVNLLLAMI